MEENRLKGNEQIEMAIERYEANSSRENMFGVADAVLQRMHEDGEFLFPIHREGGMLSFRTVTTGDGKNWGVAFTSKEQSFIEEGDEAFSFLIEVSLIKNLESDAEGLVINPWGKPFFLSKELIQAILKLEEEESIPSVEITEELLADGSFLKKAVQLYKRCGSRKNLSRLVEVLRSCTVWVPCTPMLGELDQENLEKMVRSAGEGEGLEALIGETFVAQEEVRMVPNLMQGGEHVCLPVFSSEEEVVEGKDEYSLVPCSFLRAAKMTLTQEENVAGIVFNPFTEGFVFPRGFLQTLLKTGDREREEKRFWEEED